MKNCRDVEPLKTPFVDGAAEGPDRADVERHLDACGRCRDEVEVERAARDVLTARREELRGTCPEALRAAVASAASREIVASGFSRKDRVSRTAGLTRKARTWVPMSVAASLVLVVAAIFAFGLTNKAQALAFQTTIDHVKCARFNNSATPADPVAEGARWASVYGWPLKVAASRASGLELRAVRRCAVTDGRVAHVIYQWQGEPLSVYVLPSQALPAPDEVRRFGHDAIMWAQNGRTYILLTRARQRRAELDSVVGYVKANVY